LQILEEGFVTDNSGRKINFNNCIIILTGNIGSEKISKPTIGFGGDGETAAKDKIKNELKGFFRPEFLNRLNEIIVFKDFQEDELVEIAKLEIQKLINKLKGMDLKMSATPKVSKYIASLATSEKMGARPIKRLIQKHLENPLSELILNKSLTEESEIKFSIVKEEVKYTIKEV
jgi:ATP-dependent Clp protease ATP-binding subunit ClpA